MPSYEERKRLRRERFDKFVKGWKLRECIACMGTGHYDHTGSPNCGACDGTGKERYKPAEKQIDLLALDERRDEE